MNDLARMLRRPVELVSEPPFRLDRLLVTPAALELRRGDEVRTVEPRIMEVLVALHRARGQSVSREELADLCWKGRIVGDDSLNRSISQLRKALSNEPTVAVDTIPRIGYRLRTGLSGEEPGHDLDEDKSAVAATRPWRLPVLALAAVVTAAAGYFFWIQKPDAWSASSLRPLTSDTGLETYPALSPDGRRLAYAASAGGTAARDLFVRPVAVGDAPAERITATPDADEYAAAWSPAGDRLAFVRIEANGRCSIVVTSPPGGAERAVGGCHGAPGGLAWLGEDVLVHDDRLSDDAARRLYRTTVVSGDVSALTSPPAGFTGDAAPVVSPDGQQIAFRRTRALGSDDLFVLDLRSGRERRLTHNGWKATGFAWGDDRTLFFTGNQGGDFGLWSLDVRGDAAPKRLSLGVMPLGRVSADAAGRRLAVEASRLRAPLQEILLDGSRRDISQNAADWDPDISPEGALVFGSDRSGMNEIWTMRPGGRPVRLTSLGASYAHSPRWSPDGARIAFIGVVSGQTELFVMRADGSGVSRLTRDGNAKGRVAWRPGTDELIYTTRDASGWRLMTLSLTSGAMRPVSGGEGVAVIERSGERILARRPESAALLELDLQSGAPRALNTPIDTEGLEGWAPGRDGVFHIRQAQGRASLWLTSWNGASRRISDLNSPPRANFAVRDPSSIVAPQVTEATGDLMLIEMSR